MEYLIRKRVCKIANLTILDGVTVTRLLPSEDGKSVLGVEYRSKEGGEQELRSDFVVDCGGRNTKVKSWLKEDFNIDLPQSVINSHLGYSAGNVEITQPHDWVWIYTTPIPPICNRGFILAPTENLNEYMALWVGYSGDHPPTDWAKLMEWSKDLPTNDTIDVMKIATPKGPLTAYKRTENRRYFPEKVSNWPEGFALVGDALSCFNPVYGQGMSSSILEATALDRVLGLTEPDQLAGVSARYNKLVTETVDEFWLLATMEDYRCPDVEGDPCPAYLKYLHKYFDLVITMQSHNIEAFVDFCTVFHMRKSAAIFFAPKYMFLVFKEWLRMRKVAPKVKTAQ